MQKSDLVETLSTLSEEERNRMLNYCENTPDVRPDCLDLLRYVLPCLKDSNWENLQRETVYNYLFPEREVVGNKLEKLMGRTLELVRKFIAISVFEEQMTDLQQFHYLQLNFNKRGLPDLFWSSTRQANKEDLRSPQDYYTRFLCENQVHVFRSSHNRRRDDLNIQRTINALDEYYLIERLWLMCDLLNQVQVASVDIPPFHEWVLFDFQSPSIKWFFEKPLGQLFAKVIALLSNTKGDNLQELREFTATLRHLESQIMHESIDLFEVSACNYAIRQVNKGKTEYVEIVFDFQKNRVLSGRIYLQSKFISATEFLSILSTSYRLEEFSWAKDFIETHKKKVLGVMPSQQYYEFALANYLFHTKDYQETCRILMTSDYEDIQCKISGRILEIKALAEQFFREKADHRVGEYLEDRVEAAILFFFRHKDVEATKKKMGKRFADTMKRIIHAEGKRDAERLEIILQDIAKAEYIAERQWLTKLVEDLIAQHKKK